MDTLTLERVLKKIAHSYRLNEQKKLIIGVYPCDHLSFAHTLMKKDKTSAIALIVNTDPSDKPGIHWQAIWIPEASDVKQTRSCFFLIHMDVHQVTIISKLLSNPRLKLQHGITNNCKVLIQFVVVNGVLYFYGV